MSGSEQRRLSFMASSSDNYEQILLEPYAYLCKTPGKDVRKLMTHAFNLWLQIPEDKLLLVQDVITKLHNSSLLIDDIEDSSTLRRGVPVAHLVFGIPTTINCANYVYFQAMETAAQLGGHDVMKILIDELLELHRGQGKDIYWRDENICPSIGEYIAMVKQKTGGLFRMGVKLMQLFSANKSDLMPLLDNLGLYFQIRDDYVNLVDSEYMKGKTFCEDISEGKFSFPIIHSILSDTSNRQVLSILRQRTHDEHIKQFVVDYMITVGSLDYTQEYLEQLANELCSQIASFGGNADLETLIA
eukprot:Ihof_evm2s558 gene=Ihof_evmTU2s558